MHKSDLQRTFVLTLSMQDRIRNEAFYLSGGNVGRKHQDLCVPPDSPNIAKFPK